MFVAMRGALPLRVYGSVCTYRVHSTTITISAHIFITFRQHGSTTLMYVVVCVVYCVRAYKGKLWATSPPLTHRHTHCTHSTHNKTQRVWCYWNDSRTPTHRQNEMEIEWATYYYIRVCIFCVLLLCIARMCGALLRLAVLAFTCRMCVHSKTKPTSSCNVRLRVLLFEISSYIVECVNIIVHARTLYLTRTCSRVRILYPYIQRAHKHTHTRTQSAHIAAERF